MITSRPPRRSWTLCNWDPVESSKTALQLLIVTVIDAPHLLRWWKTLNARGSFGTSGVGRLATREGDR